LNALRDFAALASDFAGRARFAVVYLEEAHPTDGWMYGAVTHQVRQPVRLSERVANARVLERELVAAQRAHGKAAAAAAAEAYAAVGASGPCAVAAAADANAADAAAASTDDAAGDAAAQVIPVVVDGMDNAASFAFGALPERLAILARHGDAGGEAARLRWLGGKGPEEYSVRACRDALGELLPPAGA